MKLNHFLLGNLLLWNRIPSRMYQDKIHMVKRLMRIKLKLMKSKFIICSF